MIGVRGYVIPDADLSWRFSRSSGPGGQHVNTTDTRVQLSFQLGSSQAFPDHLKQRMRSRLGQEIVVVEASEHRSQLRNRRAAEERLRALLEEAARPPQARRVPTKPSRGSQRRRIEQKRQRSQLKRLRGRPDD